MLKNIRIIQLPDVFLTGRVVKIKLDTDVCEYVCQLYVAGKHDADADYFTDEIDDAVSTALQMCKG